MKLITAPRLLLAGRLLGACSAAVNLLIAGICLGQLVRGDYLGILLGLALFLPLAAWLLSLRRPRLAAPAFLLTFLIVCAVWTVNELLPCSSGECSLSGFLVVTLPTLLALPTLSLLLCAGLFYAANRLQSRQKLKTIPSS